MPAGSPPDLPSAVERAAAARAACDEAGVRLVKVVSYLAPVERTDFAYVKSKKVGQARLRPFCAY